MSRLFQSLLYVVVFFYDYRNIIRRVLYLPKVFRYLLIFILYLSYQEHLEVL